jgi:biotin carboxylase
MQRFRDKVVMKRALAAAGIRVPEFAEFSAAAAAELLDRFGTVVVKPRAESGSADIRVVASPTELAGIVEWVGERAGDFEVEEFISGDLCHIDSVVADGKVVVATAGLSVSPTTAYRDLGEFIDVEIDDPLLLERLLAFNAEVIASYPGFSGVTHHEVFVCSDEIVFCEIAGRFGGGGVVPAFAAQTGISLVNAMICAQLGLPMPAVRQPRSGVTGYTLIYAPAGVLRRPVEVPDEPWVVHRRISAQPGVRRRRPTSWGQAAATITVRGRDRAEVVDRLREACSRTVIDIGPG